MSIAFESPTPRAPANEAYFTPLNMPTIHSTEETTTTNTPYFTAPINPMLHQEFLNAIHTRHAAQPTVLSPTETPTPGPRLTLNAGALASRRRATPSMALSNMPTTPPTTNSSLLVAITPDELLGWITARPDRILLIDVRSFVQFSHAQLRTALNISTPNTILKRPNFTLEKVCEVIVPGADRTRLSQWNKAEKIVFYDQSSNVIPPASAAIFLSEKFKNAGYKGDLCYLKGGFEGFFARYPHQCATSPLPKDSRALGGSLPAFEGPGLRTNMTAAPGTPALLSRRRPNLNLNALPTPSLGPFTAPMPQFENQAFNPFFSNIRQNMELSHGPIRERFPVRLPAECNIDPRTGNVAWHGPTQPRSIPGSHMDHSTHTFSPPSWLRTVVIKDSPNQKAGAQCLAEMYERLERTEQRRLQNIMLFHSKHTNNPAEYPLSIVAGIEMGALNRYTNIWPFEYTRVKVQSSESGSTDYINASFIQYADSNSQDSPLPDQVSQISLDTMSSKNEGYAGTDYRRYISTQGPLPATFSDFWQVVWEQNSRVLVMLTKEEEMNKIKCHRYWPSNINQPVRYGPLTVTMLSETKSLVFKDKSSNPDDAVILRQFVLGRQGSEKRRTITHLQYTGWMDFGVPDNPVGTLQVIKAADDAQVLYELQAKEDEEEQPVGPMVVHCSAGCGRSGAFCAIDTVLRRISRANPDDSTHDLLIETISRYREQRLSMVQTLRQFIFCYEAIWWWMLGQGHTPTSALSQ
ncbi:protein-tyrosine phosphatase-like protein [Phycomyces blakesleeanus]|uniref:protein-tyrosine-phosphatase n=1 Tax=Phycomyces blakesleeanus TaxID=4837 RepID=A0ABR3AIJ1_PHYBL